MLRGVSATGCTLWARSSLSKAICRLHSAKPARSSVSTQHLTPAAGMETKVAIVGGGFAGLSCAYALAEADVAVTVFDMGRRGVGGRASSRQQEGFCFDHGCQFLKARQQEGPFHKLVQHWLDAGFAARWQARFVQLDAATGKVTNSLPMIQHSAAGPTVAAEGGSRGFCNFFGAGPLIVGVPAMNALLQGMADDPGIVVKAGHRVTSLQRSDASKGWHIEGLSPAVPADDHGPQSLGSFSAVVLADSITQKSGSPGLVDVVGGADVPFLQHMRMSKGIPRFSLMVAFDHALEVPFDAATVTNGSAIEWLSCDTSKPARERSDGRQCWVAVSTQAYAQSLLDQAPLQTNGKHNAQTSDYLSVVAQGIPHRFDAAYTAAGWLSGMLEEMAKLLQPVLQGKPLPSPVFLTAQRWGSAFYGGLAEDCFWDERHSLGACGDFCLGGDAEAAVQSGLALAARMQSSFLDGQ